MPLHSIGEQLMRSDTISSFNRFSQQTQKIFLTCCMYPPIFYERHRTALKIVLDVRKDSRKVLQGRITLAYICIGFSGQESRLMTGSPDSWQQQPARHLNGPISGMERISVTSSMDIISPRLTISIRMRLTISELLRI